MNDPGLAIGTAKELVETCCLTERGIPFSVSRSSQVDPHGGKRSVAAEEANSGFGADDLEAVVERVGSALEATMR